jgi:hypothetical protein
MSQINDSLAQLSEVEHIAMKVGTTITKYTPVNAGVTLNFDPVEILPHWSFFNGF